MIVAASVVMCLIGIGLNTISHELPSKHRRLSNFVTGVGIAVWAFIVGRYL